VIPPEVSLFEIARAFGDVLKRIDANEDHHVKREHLSTRERMSQILAMLSSDDFTAFERLFTVEEGRAGVVVTFLALMELVKELLVELYQTEPFSVIYVKAY
jgi:segregation and condensation protein A